MKIIKLVFQVLVSALLAAIFSATISGLMPYGQCENTPEIIRCPKSPELFGISLVALFILGFIMFLFLIRKFLSTKLFFIILTLGAILVLCYIFVANPTRIKGANPGPYKDGQTVLTISRRIAPFIQLENGKVVVFESDNSSEWIAVIAGRAGDPAPRAYYLDNRLVGDTVPEGYILVRFGDKDYTRAIPESSVTRIVWLGL
jgi:hypothetical protein